MKLSILEYLSAISGNYPFIPTHIFTKYHFMHCLCPTYFGDVCILKHPFILIFFTPSLVLSIKATSSPNNRHNVTSSNIGFVTSSTTKAKIYGLNTDLQYRPTTLPLHKLDSLICVFIDINIHLRLLSLTILPTWEH